VLLSGRMESERAYWVRLYMYRHGTESHIICCVIYILYISSREPMTVSSTHACPYSCYVEGASMCMSVLVRAPWIILEKERSQY